MRSKSYLMTAAAAAIGGMALTSSAMASDGNWDGSYGPSNGQNRGSLEKKIELLRQKVKYVFVIFHENESFDHYFGTYPGANGLFEAPIGFTPANQTPSFAQSYLDTNLTVKTISPFLMPQAVCLGGFAKQCNSNIPVYPADEISVDHSHQGMANDLDVDPKTGIAANDRYAMDQEGLTTNSSGALVTKTGAAPTSITLAQAQKAEDDVDHLDCDTIPFMWSWAKNFVLFDNFHQTVVGPSTPNAIAIIAGQSGETQWALHPDEGAGAAYANSLFPNPLGATYSSNSSSTNTNAYVPVVSDPGPWPGSNLDTNTVKPPYNTDENAANPTRNLTFATQPLSFMGSDIDTIIKSDPNPAADLGDAQDDIHKIASFNRPVPWGWYQQGFGANDATDPHDGITPLALSGYVLHHNGPQYFAYLADNPAVLNTNLHGAKDFFDAVEGQTLPKEGGVFYLRGGYDNNDGLVPVDPTVAVENAFLGNDDHPGYSDQQISEAFAARAIRDIANSPYWPQSAIIITYDETDGYYDHVSPKKRSTFADGSILEAGPRIPTLVISPYAAGGTISHRYSEHGSIIKFVNELKGLVPLARLPDEERGRSLGKINLGQDNLAPSDDPDNEVGDLTEAFDTDRLKGEKAPIPASSAIFSVSQIKTLPHLATPNYSPNGYTNGACAAIGILPTDFQSLADYQNGNPIDPYPLNVNPRPTASPGTPTSGSWTP